MALINAENTVSTMQGFSSLPILRQVGLLIAFSASIAIGVSVVLWSQKPIMTPLYSSIDTKDAGIIGDTLRQFGIKHDIDPRTGSILVDDSKVHEARMKLAMQGIPQNNTNGFDMLKQEQGFSTSQFIESARYKHALETELARTISGFRNIKSARVHLAIPKQSVFIRSQKKPSASVFIDLYSGVELSKDRIGAIINLIASSVPGLDTDNVTLVDKQGRLLSNSDADGSADLSKHLTYKENLEKKYLKQINDILIPLLGEANFRAQVSTEVDFTSDEKTSELFNPKNQALRSEHVVDEGQSGTEKASGVPGADAQTPNAAESEVKSKEKINTKKKAVRNYELDRTISHIKKFPGKVNRLSVAVVVNDKVNVNEKTGKVTRTQRNEEELNKIKELITNAIGISGKRGDSVSVLNVPFLDPEKIEALPDTAIWEKPWFSSVIKQILGALFVLILVFMVIKPMFKNLSQQGKKTAELFPTGAGVATPVQGIGSPQLGGIQAPNVPGIGGADSLSLGGPAQNYQQHLGRVQDVISEDPKRVAQVMKDWVESDQG